MHFDDSNLKLKSIKKQQKSTEYTVSESLPTISPGSQNECVIIFDSAQSENDHFKIDQVVQTYSEPKVSSQFVSFEYPSTVYNQSSKQSQFSTLSSINNQIINVCEEDQLKEQLIYDKENTKTINDLDDLDKLDRMIDNLIDVVKSTQPISDIPNNSTQEFELNLNNFENEINNFNLELFDTLSVQGSSEKTHLTASVKQFNADDFINTDLISYSVPTIDYPVSTSLFF